MVCFHQVFASVSTTQLPEATAEPTTETLTQYQREGVLRASRSTEPRCISRKWSQTSHQKRGCQEARASRPTPIPCCTWTTLRDRPLRLLLILDFSSSRSKFASKFTSTPLTPRTPGSEAHHASTIPKMSRTTRTNIQTIGSVIQASSSRLSTELSLPTTSSGTSIAWHFGGI